MAVLSIDTSNIINKGVVKIAERSDGTPVNVDVEGENVTQKAKNVYFKKVAEGEVSVSASSGCDVQIFRLNVEDWKGLMVVISSNGNFAIYPSRCQFFTSEGTLVGEKLLVGGGSNGEDNITLQTGLINPDRTGRAAVVELFMLPPCSEVDYLTQITNPSTDVDINIKTEIFVVDTSNWEEVLAASVTEKRLIVTTVSTESDEDDGV